MRSRAVATYLRCPVLLVLSELSSCRSPSSCRSFSSRLLQPSRPVGASRLGASCTFGASRPCPLPCASVFAPNSLPSSQFVFGKFALAWMAHAIHCLCCCSCCCGCSLSHPQLSEAASVLAAAAAAAAAAEEALFATLSALRQTTLPAGQSDSATAGVSHAYLSVGRGCQHAAPGWLAMLDAQPHHRLVCALSLDVGELARGASTDLLSCASMHLSSAN